MMKKLNKNLIKKRENKKKLEKNNLKKNKK